MSRDCNLIDVQVSVVKLLNKSSVCSLVTCKQRYDPLSQQFSSKNNTIQNKTRERMLWPIKLLGLKYARKTYIKINAPVLIEDSSYTGNVR